MPRAPPGAPPPVPPQAAPPPAPTCLFLLKGKACGGTLKEGVCQRNKKHEQPAPMFCEACGASTTDGVCDDDVACKAAAAAAAELASSRAKMTKAQLLAELARLEKAGGAGGAAPKTAVGRKAQGPKPGACAAPLANGRGTCGGSLDAHGVCLAEGCPAAPSRGGAGGGDDIDPLAASANTIVEILKKGGSSADVLKILKRAGPPLQQPGDKRPRANPPPGEYPAGLASLAATLETKAWRERIEETIAAAGAKATMLEAKSAPRLRLSISPSDAAAAGTGGAACSALFGDALELVLAVDDQRLDLAALHDVHVGLGAECLAPLGSWAARRDPLAALVASGAATTPAICSAVADQVRKTDTSSVAGISTLIEASTLSEPRAGIARDASGLVIVDTAVMRDLSRATAEDVVACILADAGRRLACAQPAPPARSSSSYANISYAVACAAPSEASTTASRVVRFATEVVNRTGSSVRVGEVTALILAAALASDVLFIGRGSGGPSALNTAQVEAFAAGLAFARPAVRGLPAGVDEVAARLAIAAARAAWPATHKGPLAPAPPRPAAEPPARAPAAPAPAHAPAPRQRQAPEWSSDSEAGAPPRDRRAPRDRGRDDRTDDHRRRGADRPDDHRSRGADQRRAPAAELPYVERLDADGRRRCRGFAAAGVRGCNRGDACHFSHKPASGAPGQRVGQGRGRPPRGATPYPAPTDAAPAATPAAQGAAV